MSRFIPQSDMTADEIVQCSYDVMAILHLCDQAAWSICNGSGHIETVADSIGCATRLALDLMAPVHDALEAHEGRRPTAPSMAHTADPPEAKGPNGPVHWHIGGEEDAQT
jgi:hypothetical protein